MSSHAHDVVVVGAGFAGLYALHAARSADLTAVCLEAADGIGGTWYHNRYPGCRCDVESIDYSYSFDEQLQNDWVWSERYATQPEILAYLNYVADRFDLRRDIRLDSRVESARFDEAASQWHLTTAGGHEYHAGHVIFATGALSAPITPDIPGVSDFAGEVYYTAQWPEPGPDLAGKRVGVIGTGSSGIQAVPVIAEEAAELTVFQRTANYSVPAHNRPLTEEDQERIRREYPDRRAKSRTSGGGSPHEAHPKKASEATERERQEAFESTWNTGGVLFSKTFPDQLSDLEANRYAQRFFAAKIREKVRDPRVLDDLTPTDHPLGAKRICTDSGYYETFNRDHVRLVNLRRDPISRITADAVVTGTERHELDVLVFATGFDAMTGTLNKIDPRGLDGATIRESWADGPLSYLGMFVPGFPNMFVLNGPGSPAVLANMVLTSEQQVDWVIRLLVDARERGVTQVEARADAAEKWNGRVEELAERTLFHHADSWYVGANVEGKKRTFMLYAAGLGNYAEDCETVRANGYEGLILSTR